MVTDLVVLRRAMELMHELKAGYEEYLEERESYWKEGYRPHYCEHGTNQWTDYDNICGPCEDGVSMRHPDQRWAAAKAQASAEFEQRRAVAELNDAYKQATDDTAFLPQLFKAAPDVLREMARLNDIDDWYLPTVVALLLEKRWPERTKAYAGR